MWQIVTNLNLIQMKKEKEKQMAIEVVDIF